MTRFNEWTKKFGDQHWSMTGEYETLCGMPMLGNNYANFLDDHHKTPCTCCADRKDFIEVGECHD